MGTLTVRPSRNLLRGMDIDHAYDVLKDAIYCREIDIQFNWFSGYTDFIPMNGLASLIHKDGYLKSLRFCACRTPKNDSKHQVLEMFLKRVDLTFLDTFQMSRISKYEFNAFSALCRQLEKKNKGPRRLEISTSYGNFSNDDDRFWDSQALDKLGKSLSGNTEIQQLHSLARGSDPEIWFTRGSDPEIWFRLKPSQE